jgi:sorting nexin-8
MDYPEDPWGAPDLHKNHNHPPLEQNRTNGAEPALPSIPVNGNGVYGTSPEAAVHGRTTSTFTTSTIASAASGNQHNTLSTGASPPVGGSWGYFDGSQAASGGFSEPPAPAGNPVLSPFGGGPGGNGGRESGGEPPAPALSRTLGGLGRAGSGMEETILVSLMPEKEGLFFFQHHNYEVTNSRRGSKVVRRYSDFVWLLDCLHKRYPFRALPLLPPKRVAGRSTLCSLRITR